MVFVPGLPGLPGLPGATQKGGKKNTLVHRAQDVNIGIQTGRLGGEGRRWATAPHRFLGRGLGLCVFHHFWREHPPNTGTGLLILGQPTTLSSPILTLDFRTDQQIWTCLVYSGRTQTRRNPIFLYIFSDRSMFRRTRSFFWNTGPCQAAFVALGADFRSSTGPFSLFLSLGRPRVENSFRAVWLRGTFIRSPAWPGASEPVRRWVLPCLPVLWFFSKRAAELQPKRGALSPSCWGCGVLAGGKCSKCSLRMAAGCSAVR